MAASNNRFNYYQKLKIAINPNKNRINSRHILRHGDIDVVDCNGVYHEKHNMTYYRL